MDVVRRAHTVEQVREAERALMATLPEGALMQRAAAGLAYAVLDLLGSAYGRRVLLLVGSGDNGGDALYAGAMLARRGCAVEAWLLSERVHEGGLAALRAAGGRVVCSDGRPGSHLSTRPEVVVDGIVGIGGRPGLRPDAVEALAAVDGVPVVAVDVPSGVDVDTGELDGPHVEAAMTVTFGTHKIAHLVDPAASACGVVHLVDIGLDLPAAPVEALQPPDVARLLPRPDPQAHKYTRGVVGIRAGSPQYPGAGLLCVAGAATGLCGMVRYVGDDQVADRVRQTRPDVVGEGRVQAWAVGSGGGEGAGEALKAAVADGVPVVVDADALAHLTGPLGVPAVLTPHAGELAAMAGADRKDVEARPLRPRPRGRREVRRRRPPEGPAHPRREAGRHGAGHHDRRPLAGDGRRRRRPDRRDRVAAGRRTGALRRRLGRLLAARRCRHPGLGGRSDRGRRGRPRHPRRGPAGDVARLTEPAGMEESTP